MHADSRALHNRLRRIEGQVRGLQRMVDEDAYCVDILTQVAAVWTALEQVAVNVLDGHVRHCVADAVAGTDETESEAKLGRKVIAKRRYQRLKAGKKSRLRLTLSKPGRKLVAKVKRGKKLKITVIVSVKDAAGKGATARRTVSVRR